MIILGKLRGVKRGGSASGSQVLARDLRGSARVVDGPRGDVV